MNHSKAIRYIKSPFIKRKIKPLIYISYGMPKSGSTLAYELTRRFFEINGVPQFRLSNDAVSPNHKINFVRNWSDDKAIDAILKEAGKLKTTIVIKTHRPPSERIKHLASEGLVAGHIVYRDPRDIALSLMDHGKKARKFGEKAYSKINDIPDAVQHIKYSLEQFSQWVDAPNFFLIDYERLIAGNFFADKLEKQAGFKFNVDEIYNYVNNNMFTQFNKGMKRRYETEMPEDIRGLFEEEFAEFIEKHLGHNL